MKEDRSEIFVGLFLFAGLALLAGLVLRFSNFGDRFREHYEVKAEFANAGGIVRNSDVRLAGATIGKVASPPQLTADGTAITIDLHIFENFKVPENSKVVIEKEGLVGDAYVAISPPLELTGDHWKGGDLVQGVESTLEKIQDNAEQTLEKVTTALEDLDRAIQKFNDNILGEESLKRWDIAGIELTNAIKTLNEKILGEENTKNIQETIKNARIASENLAESSKKLSPILDKGQAAADKLEPTIEELRVVIGNANKALDGFSDSDGLLNALLNDSELRADFEVFVRNLRERGILRYKDDPPVEETATGDRAKRPGLGIFRKKRP